MEFEGTIASSKLFDQDKLNKITEYAETCEIHLKKQGYVLKESTNMWGLIIIPKEVWITLGFLGLTFSQWLANKVYDSLFEKVKKLLKFSHEKQDTNLLLDLQTKDNQIRINFDIGTEKDIELAFEKLKEYLLENPKVTGDIWYNDALKEWGDMNRIEEWRLKEAGERANRKENN